MAVETKDIEVANLAASSPANTPEPKEDPNDFSFLNEEPPAVPQPDTAVEPTPEEPAEKQVETPVEPTPATKIEHPRYLVEMARRLGATEELLSSTPTDQLGAMVEGALSQMTHQQRQPAAEPVKEAPKEEIDPDEADIKYLEEEVGVDPKVAAFLRRQAEKIKTLEKTKLAETEKRLKDFEEREKRREQEARVKFFDDTRDSLPDDFRAVVGKTGELSQAQHSRYVTAIMAARIDPEKDSPAVMRQKIQDAVKLLYSDFIKPAEKPAAAKEAPKEQPKAKPPGKHMTPEEWDKAVVGRPLAQKRAPTSGEKAQREAIANFFRDHDVPMPASSEDDMFDGIPD